MIENIGIYIVEDYCLTRVTLKKYIETLPNMTVLGAFESAEECISKMEETQADVILMDIGLPYMNGLEAIKILSEKYPNTRIIALTSHDKQEEVQAALASGASAYALKDIEYDELKNVITSVSKGAGWFDPDVFDYIRQTIPKPNSTKNLEDLYEKKKDAGLTEKEKEVLALIVQGKSNTEIAEILCVSPHTAKAHVSNIIAKLRVQDRVQVAVKAIQDKLV